MCNVLLITFNIQQNAKAFDVTAISHFTYSVRQNINKNTNISFIGDNMLKSENSFQNCLICLFRPAFYFGFTGITAIKFSCDHSRPPVTVFLERSILSTFIAITLLIINIVFGYLNILTLLDKEILTREDVLVLNAAAIHFIAAYLLWTGAGKAQKKIKEIRGIAELAKACEGAGFILFDDKFTRMAHYVVYAFIAVFASLEVSTICYMAAMNRDFSLKAFERLATDTCIFMQGTISTHYMLLQLVLIRLFQKIVVEIKLTAQRRFDGNVEGSKYDQAVRGSFSSRLRTLHRIYQSAYLNFMELNNFINPAFLIWWNIVLIANVVCAYVLLNSIMMHEPLELQNMFFLLLHYGTLLGLISFLILMGTLADVVSFVWISILSCNMHYTNIHIFDLMCTEHFTLKLSVHNTLFCIFIYYSSQ